VLQPHAGKSGARRSLARKKNRNRQRRLKTIRVADPRDKREQTKTKNKNTCFFQIPVCDNE
jgi:hypothetical protein